MLHKCHRARCCACSSSRGCHPRRVRGSGGGATEGDDGSGIVVAGLDSMRFAPESITVKAGEPVKIVFRNQGVLMHDYISEGAERNVRLANVPGRRTASGTSQADKTGAYNVVCIQPAHGEAGMVGKIIVE